MRKIDKINEMGIEYALNIKTGPAGNRALTTPTIEESRMAEAHPIVTLAQLSHSRKIDGTRWGEIIYQLIRDGHLIATDGIVKAVH